MNTEAEAALGVLEGRCKQLLNDIHAFRQASSFHGTGSRFERVFATLERIYGLPTGSIVGRRRTFPITEARMIAYYVLSAHHKITLSAIAAGMGGRDHGAVLNGVRRIKELMETDAKFKARVERVVKEVLAE